MNLATNGSQLDTFLQSLINSSPVEIKEIEFSEQSDWLYNKGALSHKSKGFFEIVGLLDSEKKEHLMMYQPQSALTGLVLCVKNETCYVLIQARIEPGNIGVIQYGPSIQSTPANYMALHGGKQTSVFELFNSYSNTVIPLSTSMQLDIGTRYFQKSKWHNYVLVDDLFETENHLIWASLEALQDCLGKSNFLNIDLRSLIAVFDWDKLFANNLPQKPSESFIIENLWKHKSTWKYAHKFVPIEDLGCWKINSQGIRAISKNDIGVKFYKTTCDTREVRSWSQPLITVESKGLTILLLRKIGEELQCLLSIKKEIGIDGGYSITTSYSINPEMPFEEITFENSETLVEYNQSDEGGRFYKNEILNRVVLIQNEIALKDNQYWVSMSGLKNILQMSNIASIQLRGISSVLLNYLNPLHPLAQGSSLVPIIL